ncbi:unnamed protein product [Lupinus luteus]|uniref:K-box domain-containing protein n=1 Tax=Lupinus luteus TaxID=3873 RepID=A0AAV1WX59_LUPLU
MLHQKVEYKTRELRQLNGQELHGLTLQELQRLEELLNIGLINVSKLKVLSLMRGQRQSFEFNNIRSSYLPEDDGRDTSLKLGLDLITII